MLTDTNDLRLPEFVGVCVRLFMLLLDVPPPPPPGLVLLPIGCCFGLLPGCWSRPYAFALPPAGNAIARPAAMPAALFAPGLEPLWIESQVELRDRSATGESPPA